MFARGLSPLMRWMYGSVILSYFSAFTSTPLLLLVPMITVRQAGGGSHSGGDAAVLYPQSCSVC